MIRKPPADWQRRESAAVKAVQTAVTATHRGARVARRGGHVASGLVCFFFAILWGLAAFLGGLLAGSVATFLGVGAIAAFMAWAGVRAFAKAREASG
jgi:hypothetical protein